MKKRKKQMTIQKNDEVKKIRTFRTVLSIGIGTACIASAAMLGCLYYQHLSHLISLSSIASQSENEYIVLFYSNTSSDCKQMAKTIRSFDGTGFGWYICDISSYSATNLSTIGITKTAQYNVYSTKTANVSGTEKDIKYLLYKSFGQKSFSDLKDEISFVGSYGTPDNEGTSNEKALTINYKDGTEKISAYVLSVSRKSENELSDELTITVDLSSDEDTIFSNDMFSFYDKDDKSIKLKSEASSVEYVPGDEDTTSPAEMVFSVQCSSTLRALLISFTPGSKTISESYSQSDVVATENYRFSSPKMSWTVKDGTDDEKVSPISTTKLLFTFNLNYDGCVSPTESNGLKKRITSGAIPAAPTESEASREGYTLDGWFLNKETTGDPYDFSSKATRPLSLFAKWSQNVPGEATAGTAASEGNATRLEAVKSTGDIVTEEEGLFNVRTQYRKDGEAGQDGKAIWSDWTSETEILKSSFSKTIEMRTVASSSDAEISAYSRGMIFTKEHLEDSNTEWMFRSQKQ
jgi:hypothetical protein